jgi:predicted nucleotidyltransferase
MRLTDAETRAIKETARRRFGDGCVVRLFGSRVDDALKGGDIDLHIAPERPEQAALANEIAFLVELKDIIGEQRIDVVVQTPGAPPRPIDRLAAKEGVVL